MLFQQVLLTMINGLYSFTGNQMSFSQNLKSLAAHQDQGLDTSLHQISITLVGNKTNASNECCYNATILSGSFCILPLFLMCACTGRRLSTHSMRSRRLPMSR